MNSTLKSLLFWMVLIVVGILIWQFSANFQRQESVVSFTEFLQDVEKQNVKAVTISGNEIVGEYVTMSALSSASPVASE